MQKIIYILLFSLSSVLLAQSQSVPFDHVPTDKEIIALLDVDYYPELKIIQTKYNNNQQTEALNELTNYFKQRFSERYFFDWKNFENRFAEYNQMYPDQEDYHTKDAAKHLELYPATTQWKIGFKNLKGETVTSYPYRHLTRQHKASSIAFLYHYTGDKKYLDYIPEQAASLNTAFNNNQFEIIEDGNGAYEVYRAGNRVWNWLQLHQILLASEEYSSEQQMEMIRTFLHTAAKLYHHSPDYHEGNHQTRGMSALALLSFLFPEIKGADLWKERSLKRLEEHLEKEIYADGFQFERTVHYHIADIINFFYPYQLAKLNGIQLKPLWDERISGLFDVLLKIAMPDGNAPVLQDDTREPWAEYNKIDNTMAMGALLFQKPSYKYFASSKVAPNLYWFFKPEQLDQLKNIEEEAPKIGSTALKETGYYMMRQGWEKDDLYMVISAGLTKEKPDHQHGDILGIGMYAHGNVLLPNYQVRYYLEDLEVFKNSWVKNVMLVDSIPQGRKYRGNKGGSGFGKFGELPIPEVLAWNSNSEFDFFTGTHNGFNKEGVDYFRTVLFVKNGFWLVQDKLQSKSGNHSAQQIWQGHYDVEVENKHVRSVFPNGAGLEIIQLNQVADKISKASIRSKGRVVFEREFDGEENWVTLLFPFGNFEERLYNYNDSDFKVEGWRFIKENISDEFKTDAKHLITKGENYILLGVSEFELNGKRISASTKTDLWVKTKNDKIEVTNCGIQTIEINSVSAKPGESVKL